MNPGNLTVASGEQIKVNLMNNADQNDEILREYSAIGAAILAAQRIEFLLYGLVAHVKPE